MTKRFDRVQERVKFMFSLFCAMRHYDFKDIDIYSYEDLFETMRLLVLPLPSGRAAVQENGVQCYCSKLR